MKARKPYNNEKINIKNLLTHETMKTVREHIPPFPCIPRFMHPTDRENIQADQLAYNKSQSDLGSNEEVLACNQFAVDQFIDSQSDGGFSVVKCRRVNVTIAKLHC